MIMDEKARLEQEMKECSFQPQVRRNSGAGDRRDSNAGRRASGTKFGSKSPARF